MQPRLAEAVTFSDPKDRKWWRVALPPVCVKPWKNAYVWADPEPNISAYTCVGKVLSESQIFPLCEKALRLPRSSSGPPTSLTHTHTCTHVVTHPHTHVCTQLYTCAYKHVHAHKYIHAVSGTENTQVAYVLNDGFYYFPPNLIKNV